MGWCDVMIIRINIHQPETDCAECLYLEWSAGDSNGGGLGRAW